MGVLLATIDALAAGDGVKRKKVQRTIRGRDPGLERP
jgi:hypothetical protein